MAKPWRQGGLSSFAPQSSLFTTTSRVLVKQGPHPISESNVLKECPVCRTASSLVVPSNVFPTTAAQKDTIIATYKENLSRIPCKYFSREVFMLDKRCPFGDECLYAHLDFDGHKVLNVLKPTARRRDRDDPDIYNAFFERHAPLGMSDELADFSLFLLSLDVDPSQEVELMDMVARIEPDRLNSLRDQLEAAYGRTDYTSFLLPHDHPDADYDDDSDYSESEDDDEEYDDENFEYDDEYEVDPRDWPGSEDNSAELETVDSDSVGLGCAVISTATAEEASDYDSID
ncbi:hypothetical protein BJ741DRAFT_327035 [Chytriomyces cf. hyalinus JEL632]|nr:hypothetical protein BJ741DRAFT_327035 [Chytriomyces cf. hyalinus JEL632]